MAAQSGSVEVLKELEAVNKIDFSAKNHAGDTPMSLALGQRHMDAVEYITNILSGTLRTYTVYALRCSDICYSYNC